ncbi:ABC transporter permease subunit [Arcanobacterium phocisimile]|uniref:ABC transporter permease subunit n=1 Tax=Arcanobacterium phocisimile TaxID=1302235 RepID=A0ABX7IFP4_9ACTO|nr:ABC transporter permease subunit [Arcanobacterium phocisimile]QRV01647.1 ABC transporter permease subunit [Arcanobacterium phocisimile]
MSIAYGRFIARENMKIFVIITLVVSALLMMMLSVFTPETIKSIEAMRGSRAMGDLPKSLSLTGFLGNFYKVHAILIPTIYSIVVGNRLLADKIDRGTMAGFLSTPITRREITVTSALYFISSIALMWLVIGGAGLAFAHYKQPGELDVSAFISLNIGIFTYHILIAGICFAASGIFNMSRYSLLVGAGLSVSFFIMSMFAQLSDSFEWMRKLTPVTLFDTDAIIDGATPTANLIGLGLGGLVLFIVGIVWFDRKDLPL